MELVKQVLASCFPLKTQPLKTTAVRRWEIAWRFLHRLDSAGRITAAHTSNRVQVGAALVRALHLHCRILSQRLVDCWWSVTVFH